ncbi:hypothetical protein NKG94_15970 [Micromonospora sp. M12]
MHGELQRIVDAVAARVGRPALIEDRRQRVVAYSEHDGPMDDVRRTSILRRQTTPEVIAWFRGMGVLTAYAPVRTPPAPSWTCWRGSVCRSGTTTCCSGSSGSSTRTVR